MVGILNAATARTPAPRVLEVLAVAAGQWIERYRRAWETADTDEVVDLFTSDASSGPASPASPSLAATRSASTGDGVSARSSRSPSAWADPSSPTTAWRWSGGRQ
jgi:hypothetical protein